MKTRKWWDEQHVKQNTHLSGHSLTLASNFLKFGKYLKPGSTVLCIGVGNGTWMDELYKKGIHMYGLDISNISLSSVKQYCIQTFNTDNMKLLPKDTFDLAVSFYVAQHMENTQLEEQFKCVFPSLKKRAVFALQYLELLDMAIEPDYNQQITKYPGRIYRSGRQMTSMAYLCGGEVIKTVSDIPSKRLKLREVGIHMQRIRP